MSHIDYSDEEWYDDREAAVEHAEIDSPRLLIACRKQGIQPHELLKKSVPEIREMYKQDKLTKAGIMLAAQHYEERRVEKLRIVLKERARIIDDEQEWARVPVNQKRSDLHLAKGRTTQASPKDNEAKRRKERRQLGEMLLKQQEEMDEFIENEEDYLKAQGDFGQRLAYTRAKESQLREKLGDHEAIELIGDEEFEYDHVGKKGIELLKKKGQQQQANGRRRRMKQKFVYKREIDNFNANQKRLLEKDRQNRTHWLTKKSEGILLENRVIFAHPHRREKMSQREIAMKDYLVEQMKLREEEDTKMRKDKDTVLKIAKTQSKKWLDSKQSEIKRGMGVYEEREKEFGPSFRNAVKAAQKDPAMYSRIIQQSLFEPKDKPNRFVKHEKYNSEDSDEAEANYRAKDYDKYSSPMGSMTTKSTWRLGGENRKTIYDVTGWKRLTQVDDAGKKYARSPPYSSISSEFAKQTPVRAKVSVLPKYSHDESDNEWEDELYGGRNSPNGGVGTKTSWGHPHISRRSDKTIYDVTRWKRISDPTVAEERKLKTGHNSITSNFVRNSAPQSSERPARNNKAYESDGEWEEDLYNEDYDGGVIGKRVTYADSHASRRRDKTIYDITHWKRISDPVTAEEMKLKSGHNSITSNFVKNSAPNSVRKYAKNSNGQESDSEWEDGFNRGSPARDMGVKDFWNRDSYSTPRTCDKTIYDITGWSRMSDGEIAARSNHKRGYSSVTSDFVRDGGMPEGQFLRKPSHQEGKRFGINKHDDDEQALYDSQLRQNVLAARIEKEHELKSEREYEREREIHRGMVLGSFDTKKERKYVEKVVDAERRANKTRLQNMFQPQYGLI